MEAKQLRRQALLCQKVELLRDFCRELGLADLGTTAELVTRILEALDDTEQNAGENVAHKEVWLSITLILRLLAARPKEFIIVEVPQPIVACASDGEADGADQWDSGAWACEPASRPTACEEVASGTARRCGGGGKAAQRKSSLLDAPCGR